MKDILRAEEAAFLYLQGHWGLEATSLAVQPGESVLVTGPSGCGKSTLARCLTGLIPHLYHGELKGTIWLDGKRTDDTPLWQIVDRVGLVFQNPAGQMLAQTVEDEIIFGLENLGLPQHIIRDRVEESLSRFGLEPLRDRSPQTLSGGEQQKLALASITARRPPVLVLDEPLSMLDSTAAADLVAHLDHLVLNETAVIICEHRKEYLKDLTRCRSVQLGDGVCVDKAIPETRSPWGDRSSFRLEVTGLKIERGGRAVIHDLSFSTKGGRVVAVVGRNGVGKTTLLRAFAGIQKFTGSLAACKNGSKGEPDLGMVFQNSDIQLFNATVREEILYRIPNPDKIYYCWLLEVLGLAPYEDSPPLLLSEGEKKRVALATMLMRKPRHGILLDEPALGQDASHKGILVRLVRALAEAGQLVVMATHDLELASKADHLVLLGTGGIVAEGPPSEIMRDGGVWERLGLVLPEWVRSEC